MSLLISLTQFDRLFGLQFDSQWMFAWLLIQQEESVLILTFIDFLFWSSQIIIFISAILRAFLFLSGLPSILLSVLVQKEPCHIFCVARGGEDRVELKVNVREREEILNSTWKKGSTFQWLGQKERQLCLAWCEFVIANMCKAINEFS